MKGDLFLLFNPCWSLQSRRGATSLLPSLRSSHLLPLTISGQNYALHASEAKEEACGGGEGGRSRKDGTSTVRSFWDACHSLPCRLLRACCMWFCDLQHSVPSLLVSGNRTAPDCNWSCSQPCQCPHQLSVSSSVASRGDVSPNDSWGGGRNDLHVPFAGTGESGTFSWSSCPCVVSSLGHSGKHCRGWRVMLLWEEDDLGAAAGGACSSWCQVWRGEDAGQAPSLIGTVLPRGSALANTISQFTLALLLFLYILGRKLHQATWGGKDCLLSSNLDVGFVLG